MASDQEFVKFVCEQLRGAGAISSRRMFGEAAIYLHDKVIGFVFDNQFFFKPTDAGRAMIGDPIEAPLFPGSSNWFLMADLDDPEFLAELARTTFAALPAPRLKSKSKPKSTRRKSEPESEHRSKLKPKSKQRSR
jgi:DNA transformation protein and related proteins